MDAGVSRLRPLRAGATALCVLGSLLSTPAAAGFSFTSDITGETFGENSRAEFSFGLLSPATVTLRTWSYAGGTNYEGQEIPPGGFDPVVSVFDSDGRLIGADDDGSPSVNPENEISFDSLLTLELDAANYAAVLTEYPNFSTGTIDEFEGVGTSNITDGSATAYWALDILNVDGAHFQGIVNPATGQVTIGTQEQFDAALQAIAVNDNTSSTARVISRECPLAPVGSRFSEDCTPIIEGALTPEGSPSNAQAGAALVAVTDEQATVPLSSSRASIGSQIRNLSARLSAVRAGVTGLSVGGLAFNVDRADGGFEDLMAGTPLADRQLVGGPPALTSIRCLPTSASASSSTARSTRRTRTLQATRRASRPTVGPSLPVRIIASATIWSAAW